MPDTTPCVHCRRRPAEARWRPFCSERCKMADLGRWLRGDYRVAGGPAVRDDDFDDLDDLTTLPPAGPGER